MGPVLIDLCLFLPTLSALVMTCDTNVTRKSRQRRPRMRSSPDTTEPDKERKADALKKSSGGSSSERMEEKTCQDMGIDAEEADTQEETVKDTDKEARTATSTKGATTAGPWPVGAKMGKLPQPSQHTTRSSVFDVVVESTKKDDVPSEFELDSVKRLQKMSKEPLYATTQNTATANSKQEEVVVEIGSAMKSPPPSCPKKKKKSSQPHRDYKKEEEVRRWNEAIARGNVYRPRKDDETVDEVHADWGDPQ
ncbi:hypothetical protein PRIPAC_73387 [Pristionchus pacificus]|uniref:Uncharacterized protein n=1 Tax=Pristionchus pacificus TaxID=54126 RepID=A0A2A6C6X3_PRIPA|nr:hypothetical protein PRIPAC_73387 [Pristionchus pacificus]|eukprot:PDM73935.1 hypothetical protein PRIPAC_41291 [Pristionchus pacificus]